MSDAPNTTTNSGVLCSPPPPPSLTPSIKINNQDQSECDRSEAAMYSVTMITTAPHVVEATAPAPAPAAFGETNTTASTSTSLAPPGKDLLNTPRPSIASTIMASYENDRYTALIREIIRSDSLISGERSSSNSFNSNRSTRSNLTPITNELNATGHLHCLRNLQAGSSDDHHHHHDDDYAIDVEMAQAMQRLLAMQHINEARQCGVLSTPGGKVCRDRRYYWDKVRDHSHRAKRFALQIFIFVVSLLIYSTLIYVRCGDNDDEGLLQAKSIVLVVIASIITTIFLMSLSTFKRWFYYWDPDFSFTRPS